MAKSIDDRLKVIDLDEADTDDEMNALVHNDEEYLDEVEVHECNGIGLDHPFLDGLYKHQKKGALFAIERHEAKDKNGCFILDEMGLGKTAQALVAINVEYSRPTNKDQFYISVIICGKTLLHKWKKEAKRWATAATKIELFHGANCKKVASDIDQIFGCIDKIFDFKKNHPTDSNHLLRAELKKRASPYKKTILITTYETLISYTGVEARGKTNPNVFKRWYESSRDASKKDWDRKVFQYLVMDEGHKLKKEINKCRKAVDSLRFQSRVILTGTPLQNKTEELYSLFAAVIPNKNELESILGSKNDFQRKAHAIRELAKSDRTDNPDLHTLRKELHQKIRPYMIRRTKACMPQIFEKCPKTICTVFVTLTEEQRAGYTKILTHSSTMEVRNELIKAKERNVSANAYSGAIMPLATRLGQVCQHPYLISLGITSRDIKEFKEQVTAILGPFGDITESRVAELTAKMNSSIFETPKLEPFPKIKDMLAESAKMQVMLQIMRRRHKEGRKTLIFSDSVPMLIMAEALLNTEGMRTMMIVGSTTGEERQKLSEKFSEKSDNHSAMLISIGTGSEGMDFVTADGVILLEPNWAPSKHLQAIDRIHRIGQTRPVSIWRLVTPGTIEEIQYKRMVNKEIMSKAVLKNSPITGMFSGEDVAEFITRDNYDMSKVITILDCFESKSADTLAFQEEKEKIMALPYVIGVINHAYVECGDLKLVRNLEEKLQEFEKMKETVIPSKYANPIAIDLPEDHEKFRLSAKRLQLLPKLPKSMTKYTTENMEDEEDEDILGSDSDGSDSSSDAEEIDSSSEDEDEEEGEDKESVSDEDNRELSMIPKTDSIDKKPKQRVKKPLVMKKIDDSMMIDEEEEVGVAPIPVRNYGNTPRTTVVLNLHSDSAPTTPASIYEKPDVAASPPSLEPVAQLSVKKGEETTSVPPLYVQKEENAPLPQLPQSIASFIYPLPTINVGNLAFVNQGVLDVMRTVSMRIAELSLLQATLVDQCMNIGNKDIIQELVQKVKDQMEKSEPSTPAPAPVVVEKEIAKVEPPIPVVQPKPSPVKTRREPKRKLKQEKKTDASMDKNRLRMESNIDRLMPDMKKIKLKQAKSRREKRDREEFQRLDRIKKSMIKNAHRSTSRRPVYEEKVYRPRRGRVAEESASEEEDYGDDVMDDGEISTDDEVYSSDDEFIIPYSSDEEPKKATRSKAPSKKRSLDISFEDSDTENKNTAPKKKQRLTKNSAERVPTWMEDIV